MHDRAAVTALVLATMLLATLPAAAAGGAAWEVRAAPQVTTGERVVASFAVLREPGYVVVYGDRDGAPHGLLGASTLLPAGQHAGVVVPLDNTPREEATRLHAVLHRDDGDGTWEGSAWDPGVERDGAFVEAAFPVEQGPGEVALAAGDQLRGVRGVELARVWVPSESIVTLHRDRNGTPGAEVASHGTLAPGHYQGLPVEVPRSKLPQDDVVPLWAVLRHADGEAWSAGGEPVQARFTVATHQPDVDVALKVGNGDPVPLRRVVADGPTWVVVHPEAAKGGPDVDRALGSVLLERGVHHDVRVPLDDVLDPGTRVYAVLHEDAPEDGAYTYPDGDAPVVARGAVAVEAYVVPDPPTREVPSPGAWLVLGCVGVAALLRQRSGVA